MPIELLVFNSFAVFLHVFFYVICCYSSFLAYLAYKKVKNIGYILTYFPHIASAIFLDLLLRNILV